MNEQIENTVAAIADMIVNGQNGVFWTHEGEWNLHITNNAERIIEELNGRPFIIGGAFPVDGHEFITPAVGQVHRQLRQRFEVLEDIIFTDFDAENGDEEHGNEGLSIVLTYSVPRR